MNIFGLIRRYERRRRFWRNVRVGGPDDCWPWLGPTDENGHGLSNGRLAHERAWELSGRSLPSGVSLEHRCGHPWCVNPHHLEKHSHGGGT
jgi:hypothetical protein